VALPHRLEHSSADPLARWCGRREVNPPADPIRRVHYGLFAGWEVAELRAGEGETGGGASVDGAGWIGTSGEACAI